MFHAVKYQFDETPYFPISEGIMEYFFKSRISDFDFSVLKYKNDDNLDEISQIISSVGISGYNYIQTVEKVIDFNKPVMLFYGIEQLCSFFSYLHFNFTVENPEINKIKEKFKTHGIGSAEFNNIELNSSINELLNKKIILRKEGAAQRFFLVLGFPIKAFLENQEFKLKELIYSFFKNPFIQFSSKTIQLFLDDFKFNEEIQIGDIEDYDLFIIYLLSFLFAHLSRYKPYTWQKLLNLIEKNIGFYIKFLMTNMKDIFIRKLFTILYFERDRMERFSKSEKMRKLFANR